jgi:hypothetical protein
MARPTSPNSSPATQEHATCRRILLLVAAVVALVLGPGASPAPAQGKTCPQVTPAYTGPCGPTFVLPGWGDAGGWTTPEQYETIQLADVDGDGADELLARTPAGVAIHVFDKTLGQWRPQVDANNVPVILTEFANPPPLTTANPNPPATDWTLPQYYDTIQAADIDGQKGEEILGRSASGLIVFKFTPGASPGQGSWRQLTTAGPFAGNGWAAGPFYYATIQTGDIDGDGDAEVIGRGSDGLYAFDWTGSSWKQLGVFGDLGDKGGYNQPQYWPSIRLANIDGDLRDELVARDASGLSAYKYRSGSWTKISRYYQPFSDDPPPGGGPDCPFTSPGNTCFGAGPAYYGTIQFADVDGSGRDELLGRASDGLRVLRYRGDTPDAWGRLATLSDLSDANGYTAQQYWETIQFADVNGDGRAEALARDENGLNAWSYDPGAKAWTKLAPATPLALADDPWGSDRSYYSTIETGDVDGDRRADVIARGPYGIRTWFYNRPGTSGWGSYLPSGYPDDEFSAARKDALAKLNSLAVDHHLITGGKTSVREVWTGATAPSTSVLDDLRDGLVSLGGCTNKTSDVPLQYQTCGTPPDGVKVADWTPVLNEILAENFWAKLVVEYFDDLQEVQHELFLEETSQLTKMGNAVGVEAAKNNRTSMSGTEFWSAVTGIAGGIAGLIPVVGGPIAAVLGITSEVISMVPSATEKLSDRFEGTYDEFQARFADGVADAATTTSAHSELVRGDRGLLFAVAQQYDRIGRTLDKVGMESAGRQGFALQVYKELLPTVYVRWVISGCQHQDPFQTACDGIPAGTPGVVGTPFVFTAIGSPPAPGSFPHLPWPCWQPLYWLCHYDQVTLPADLSTTLWGKVDTKCVYQGSAAQQWTFGCNLGLDPYKTTLESSIPHQDWPFLTYTGTPVVLVCTAGTGCEPIGGVTPPPRAASVSLAPTGRKGLAVGRRTTVRLRGGFGLPRPVRLARARVSVRRLLDEPDGARELVGVGARMRRPRLTLLPRAGRGRTWRAYARRRPGGPRARLRLRRRGRGLLSFDLRLPGARVAPPAACSGTRPGVDLATGAITLRTRLRIDDGRRRPVAITLNTRWRCRRNRLAAVRWLTPRRPYVRNPRRPSLALGVRGPRRLHAGRTVAYRIRVSNRRPTLAYDVVVRAFPPRAYRLLHAPGARRARPEVVWRLARLRAGRSKTMLLRLRIPRGAARTRSRLVVATHAIDTRSSVREVNTRVQP